MINVIEMLNFLEFSNKPSEYFQKLKYENNVGQFPELNSLIGCLHEPFWHSEGDVWIHTLMVVDVAAEIRHNFTTQTDRIAFMLGALCHDFGKPYTNQYDKGKIRSIMHDQYGEVPTDTFLSKLNISDYSIRDKVQSYVRHHLIPMQLYKSEGRVSDKAIRKLQDKIHIPDLVLLTRADHWGRNDEEAIKKLCPAADYLLDRFIKLSF
jgi:tRNA nucleotidyltransferase (CCA-adding enzyme)